MTLVRRIVLVALVVLVLVGGWSFAHGNAQPIEIDLVIGRTGEIATWKALGLAVAVGVLGTALVLGFSLARARLESRRYRKALADLETEVHQLRNLPLVEDAPAAPAAAAAVATGGAVQNT